MINYVVVSCCIITIELNMSEPKAPTNAEIVALMAYFSIIFSIFYSTNSSNNSYAEQFSKFMSSGSGVALLLCGVCCCVMFPRPKPRVRVIYGVFDEPIAVAPDAGNDDFDSLSDEDYHADGEDTDTDDEYVYVPQTQTPIVKYY